MSQTVMIIVGPALRGLFPVAFAAAILFALRDAQPVAEPAMIAQRLAGIAPWQWALSLIATAACFGFFGRTEATVHRWIGTNRNRVAARHTAMAALGVTQATGLGPLVGLLVRWRCDPDGGMARAATVTALSSLAFLTALALLAALSTLVTGVGGTGLRSMAWTILGVAVMLVLASALSRARRGMPSLSLLLALGGWGMADALAATLAFWAFVPDLPILQVLPAFLLSLGAGLVSGLPGGVGSFDLTLSQMLPGAEPALLLTAATAFRIAHVAAPASLSVAGLLLRPGLFDGPAARASVATSQPPADATRAEAGLLAQPGALALNDAGGLLAVCWPAPHTLAQIGPGFHGAVGPDALKHAASELGKLALAYKIAPSEAAGLRARGWSVLRLGAEAVVDTAAYNPDSPAYRQLRRKLRKAEGAGMTLRTGGAPLRDMARIDAVWQNANGTARGVSMGRFAPEYVARQRIFTAWRDGRAMAFITLHAGRTEWALDLMRWEDGCPDGTMHALVALAIATARAEGLDRVSLAAVPDGARWQPANAAGLRRFKGLFAPRWLPLYAAAPTRAALALGLADLLADIVYPPAIAAAHDDHEGSAFARVTHP